MRRLLPLLIFTLTGCSGPSADPGPPSGSFSGAGRDRLCIAGEGAARRAGVIVFGEGDVNCSAAGTLVAAGTGYALVPLGEGACRIGLSVAGDAVTVTTVPGACAYVCGPGASLAGKRFQRDAAARPVTDFGGDALC